MLMVLNFLRFKSELGEILIDKLNHLPFNLRHILMICMCNLKVILTIVMLVQKDKK